MFKSLLLQQWYGLSDSGLEESLRDRLSFQGFVGLGLDDPVPDETTFVVFRKRLIAANLGQKLFELVNAQLDARKLFVRKGAIIDATIVDAAVRKPRSPKSRKGHGALENDQAASATVGEELAGENDQEADATSASPQSVDPDASWTYKHGTWYYGYKIHCCIDEGQLLIRTLVPYHCLHP
jgi:IS5 family transposase